MEKVEIRARPGSLQPLVVGNKVYRSSKDHKLSFEDLERARLELNETEDVRRNSLRILKEMLATDGTKYRTDDSYLLRFLRCRKFNCAEAYKMMRYIYATKRDYPDIFYSLHPDMEAKLAVNKFTFLPYRDEDGSIVIVDKVARWNPQEQSISELIQLFQPISDIMTMNPSCQINKVVGIFDCIDTNISHLYSTVYPTSLLLWTKTAQNLQPWRVKYLIILNCNSLARKALALGRRLAKKKIAERIVVIGSDMKELHKYVSPAILPKEYGGSLEESEWGVTQHVMDNLSYLQYEHSFYKEQKH